jgi:hypothetical protein
LKADIDVVGTLASRVISEAIISAVNIAELIIAILHPKI